MQAVGAKSGAVLLAWALSRYCSTNARRIATVAIQACMAFCGYLGTSNCNQGEEEKTEKRYKAHGNLRSTTFLLQSCPQPPLVPMHADSEPVSMAKTLIAPDTMLLPASKVTSSAAGVASFRSSAQNPRH